MRFTAFYGLALAMASTLAMANPPSVFDVPYQPPPAVVDLPDIVGAWTEVYLLKGPVQTAFKALTEQSTPPPALGVSAGGALHVSVRGKQLAIPETALTVTRDRAPVAYQDDCSVVPKKGDVFAYTFDAPGLGELTLNASVLEHFAFGRPFELVAQAVRLDLRKPAHCDAVEESRLVLSGTLSYSDMAGSKVQLPVMLQHVVIR